MIVYAISLPADKVPLFDYVLFDNIKDPTE